MEGDTKFELLGVMIPSKDKRIIKEIASNNRITMSDVARMLISDSLAHITERDILKI